MGHTRRGLLGQTRAAYLPAWAQGLFMLDLVALDDQTIAFSAYAYRFAAHTPS